MIISVSLILVNTGCQKDEFEPDGLCRTSGEKQTKAIVMPVAEDSASDATSGTGANSIILNTKLKRTEETTTRVKEKSPVIQINIKEVSDGDDEADNGDDSSRG